MTYEEALNFNQKWTAKQAFNDLERYLLRQEPPAMKAVAVAMQALEKQTPKKPVKEMGEIVCPTCETLVGSRPYCGYCGQAIDWSKEE